MNNIIEIYDKELEKQAMQITEIFIDVANKENKTLEEVVEIYYNVIKTRSNSDWRNASYKADKDGE